MNMWEVTGSPHIGYFLSMDAPCRHTMRRQRLNKNIEQRHMDISPVISNGCSYVRFLSSTLASLHGTGVRPSATTLTISSGRLSPIVTSEYSCRCKQRTQVTIRPSVFFSQPSSHPSREILRL